MIEVATAVDTDRIDQLEAKIDRLTEQIEFLAATARAEELRRLQWDELRHELAPIAGEAFEIVSRELDEVKDFVEPADGIRVMKRLARNLPMIERGLDQLESIQDLAADIGPLTGEITLRLMRTLDEFERKGYFGFAQSGMGVFDRVVTSFTEEDVEALGDNIVLILNTVKEMTQPEVMQLLQRTATGVRNAEPTDVGLFGMMRRMRDPKVRRGLGRMIEILESMGEGGNAEVPTNDEEDDD